MGCFSKQREVKDIHKWQYINLNDFRSKSCFTGFSYLWIWGLAITGVVVYVLDTFILINLLAFNNWSSQIQPKIDFNIQKWVFVGCILFSYALAVYEWTRAIRVMKQHSVTEDYLDDIAVILQCIRIPGGWRRFLVFAELTKSKKKAAWVALYVYWQRKTAIRVLLAEGPRNVINAFTIYSVAKSDLLSGDGERSTFIVQLAQNIRTLFIEHRAQALVLGSMVFTFVIWFICFLMLIVAILFYIFFLWSYLSKETLTGYCRRKVEARLAKTVKSKTDKIWAQQEAEAEKAAKKGGATATVAELPFGGAKRQPTLPVFGTSPPKSGDYLSRMESTSTLPRYQSKPGTPADETPPPFPREYSGNSSLLGNAGPMGQSGPYSRPGTSQSNHSFSRGPQLPPIYTPNDRPNDRSNGGPNSNPSSKSSSFESTRRYSPPSANPWRTPVTPLNEDAGEYELRETGMPSALRPAMGRRDMSSPGPDRNQMPHPPNRSFTSPAGQMSGPPRNGTPAGPSPWSMTPGGPAGLPRSMTPGNGAPLPRSMTPSNGAPLPRSMTPGNGAPLPRSMTPGVPPSLRSNTPGAQSIRSQGPGTPMSYRNQGPGRRPSNDGPGWRRPSDGGSGGGPASPGMAF